MHRRISLNDLLAEPFRWFFPAAILAALLGVALWPLHFAGLRESYPGASHARLMAHGFFGGFIFGFLATALPRMLGVKRLSLLELALVFTLHTAMVIAHVAGHTLAGDALLLLLVLVFGSAMAVRFRQRTDLPPPGFVLVFLALACLAAGAGLALVPPSEHRPVFWFTLGKLLSYQGFVLLPILGVGGFLLPRFFGLSSRHDFPESVSPPRGWTSKAVEAATVGGLIVATFFLEAAGWVRLGPLLRVLVITLYLVREVPFYRSKERGNALSRSLVVAFGILGGGLLAIALFPAFRTGLLHLTLMGGFAVITLVVATRVVFGHSGNFARLNARNRWFLIAVALMLLGMATRISGDFWPKIMQSHYNYGALLWGVGVLLWSAYVLPKVLKPDPDRRG